MELTVADLKEMVYKEFGCNTPKGVKLYRGGEIIEDRSLVTHGDFTIRNTSGLRQAYFNLQQLPGCCGVMLFNGLGYTYAFPNPKVFLEFAEAFAEAEGYTILMATDILGGSIQKNLTEGWKETFNFVNDRTGNEVGVYVKELSPSGNHGDEDGDGDDY